MTPRHEEEARRSQYDRWLREWAEVRLDPRHPRYDALVRVLHQSWITPAVRTREEVPDLQSVPGAVALTMPAARAMLNPEEVSGDARESRQSRRLNGPVFIVVGAILLAAALLAGFEWRARRAKARCFTSGVAYFREAGSYPTLTTAPNMGRLAEDVVRERCERTSSAFQTLTP